MPIGEGVLTVTDVNRYIKALLDSSDVLNGVSVRGEISNFKYHSSGHMYFSLKDEGGLIRSVMFRSAVAGLAFVPKEGMRVIADGSVTVYPRDGQYQLYISRMRPDGIGALYQAFEALKKKLGEEGLFDQRFKKKLPPFPRRIGIVTSKTGAAIRDMVNILSRRYPPAEIFLRPAEVQGVFAPSSLIEGIRFFESTCPVDVLIIGRGGGSFEDLCAFNDEALARTIFAAKTPIISAVGHETDFTICDFAADLRAPTPSAAAELAVPDRQELYQRLDALQSKMKAELRNRRLELRGKLDRVCQASWYKRPQTITDDKRQLLQRKEDKLATVCKDLIAGKRKTLNETTTAIRAMDPLAVLKRGYAIPSIAGKTLMKTNDANPGDILDLILYDGNILAEVTETHMKAESGGEKEHGRQEDHL